MKMRCLRTLLFAALVYVASAFGVPTTRSATRFSIPLRLRATVDGPAEDIKQEIADTKAKLKKAEEEAEKSGDYTRRDRLEELLLEQQKEKNIVLAGSGN